MQNNSRCVFFFFSFLAFVFPGIAQDQETNLICEYKTNTGGIDVINPSPHPGGGLASVKAEFLSPYGLVKSSSE